MVHPSCGMLRDRGEQFKQRDYGVSLVNGWHCLCRCWGFVMTRTAITLVTAFAIVYLAGMIVLYAVADVFAEFMEVFL